MPQQVLNARSLKCTVVLDPAEVAQLVAPDGHPRVVVTIQLPDRRLTVDVNAKAVRKALALIREQGPDGVAVIMTGKLVGNTIAEAGLVAQPRPPKPQAVAEAAAA